MRSDPFYIRQKKKKGGGEGLEGTYRVPAAGMRKRNASEHTAYRQI